MKIELTPENEDVYTTLWIDRNNKSYLLWFYKDKDMRLNYQSYTSFVLEQ